MQDADFWNECSKASTLKRIRGPKSTWIAPNGEAVTLPVSVDLVWRHEPTGVVAFKASAEVVLLDGAPRLTQMTVSSPVGLVPPMLQAAFRWQSPLDVVTITVPALLKAGVDPFAFPLPTDGFPQAAMAVNINDKTRLSDAFLESVVKTYLAGGRGYAKKIAATHGVSQRTVVSWIQKARERGILSKTKPGSRGGELMSPQTTNRRRATQKPA